MNLLVGELNPLIHRYFKVHSEVLRVLQSEKPNFAINANVTNRIAL